MVKLVVIALLILLPLREYVERHRKPREFQGDYTEARAEAETLWQSLLNCSGESCCRGSRTSKTEVVYELDVERIDVWGRELKERDIAAKVEFDGTTTLFVRRSRSCDAEACGPWRPGAAGMNVDLTYFIIKRNGQWIARSAGDSSHYFRPARCPAG